MVEKLATCPKCDSFEVENKKENKYECTKCGCKFIIKVREESVDISKARYPEPYLTLARQGS